MKLKSLLAGVALISSISFASTQGAQFSVLPGVQFGATKADSIDGFSFNLLGAENQNVSGFDLSFIGYRKVNGNFNGLHLSLFLEAFRVDGDMKGVSLSLWNDIKGNVNGGNLGLVNTVGGDATFQLGGVNIVNQEAMVQLGFINYAQQVGGLQFGLVNATKKLEGLQVGLVNYAENGVFPVLPIVNFRKTLF